MTNQEAATFAAQLRAGKRFVTRHQEEEWGLTYEGNGRYRKWSRIYDQETEETLTEEALLALLSTHYNFDTMMARLRD